MGTWAQYVYIYLQVGGLEHEFYFPFHIWDGIILPIDFHILQDGYCTTNQYIYMYMDKLLFCDLTEMMVRKGHCAQLAQRFSNMIWYSLSNINDIVSAMR
jgi:hypothetical protein